MTWKNGQDCHLLSKGANIVYHPIYKGFLMSKRTKKIRRDSQIQPIQSEAMLSSQVDSPIPPLTGENNHLMKSASLVSAGTFFGSLLGMVRQIVVAHLGSEPWRRGWLPPTLQAK
jgi:hypothetical protein